MQNPFTRLFSRKNRKNKEKRIVVPPSIMVEPPLLRSVQNIPTRDSQGVQNGQLFPLVNLAEEGTTPVELIYLTECRPGMIKGPHVHRAPMGDRFICIRGECMVLCRNEQTGAFSSFFLDMVEPQILQIPPWNSHAIASKAGCAVLSICNESYIEGQYNQEETSYPEGVFDDYFAKKSAYSFISTVHGR